jgi:hypothetical protein
LAQLLLYSQCSSQKQQSVTEPTATHCAVKLGKETIMHSYQITQYYQVRSRAHYESPCRAMPDRKLVLSPADILTKITDGTYVRLTGAYVRGIRVPDADLVLRQQPLTMVVG